MATSRFRACRIVFRCLVLLHMEAEPDQQRLTHRAGQVTALRRVYDKVRTNLEFVERMPR